MVSDPGVEAAAIAEAMAYGRARGWDPQDVAAQNRGFDILSRGPEGQIQFIEVKGRAGTIAIALTANEFRTAQRLASDYWLYAVFNCTMTPELYAVEDPARLGWKRIVGVEHFLISPEEVQKAAIG